MKWFNPKKIKPQEKVFWALTGGRSEQGQRDWEIRKMQNDIHGDYRTLDDSSSYSFESQNWYNKIYAWLPIEEIPIDIKDFDNET